MVIVKSCRYTHPEIGPIYVRVNANSRCIRARWVGPELHITIPRNLPADEYERFIYDFGQKIKEAKPQSRYHAGQIIDGNYADFEIRISDSKAIHGSFISQEDNNPRRGKKRNYTLNISDKLLERLDFGTPRLENFIISMLIMCGEGATSDFIVPRARQHAAAIGHSPPGWDVKDSKTRLGCCSSRGIITLSPRLAFLPLHLADYIIYHELAHLSEMNHSAAFHQICDSYCGGREDEYRAAVKAFDFPVF